MMIINLILRVLIVLVLIGLTDARAAETEKEALKEAVVTAEASSPQPWEGASVAIAEMKMMILPGTMGYLEKSIAQAQLDKAAVLIVRLDTPGGMLNTSQDMVQMLLNSPIPVVIYVGPKGATATSAGVFITLASHIAVMAPGTSIGAAHPVTGEGKDIEGDMRKKAENMTIAMVRSISEERGRNVEWAEKSVKESSSITHTEAVEMNVVDLVAEDVQELLKKIKGKEVRIGDKSYILGDYSNLPQKTYQMTFTDQTINVLANPNIAALLWLAATTGISLELYNPGAILPGVVGIICLIVALAVSQIIPVTYGGVLLLVLGALLIGLELYVASGVLGFGGIVAIVLGSIYLIDVSQAPGLEVDLRLIIPMAAAMGGFLLFIVFTAMKTFRKKPKTGLEGMVGARGEVSRAVSSKGKVFVNGEYWNARAAEGVIEQGAEVEVIGVHNGLVLEVRRAED